MLDPSSRNLVPISDLFNISLAISAVIFALVVGLILYIAFKFRARSNAELPAQNAGHTRLEIVWTVGPLLIVGTLFVLTIVTMGKADPSGQPSLRVADIAAGKQQEPRFDITVTGHQWWWEVSYSGTPITSANEIHIPVGKPVLLRLASADVVHDLWIVKLSRKTDMVPGSYNYMTLQADAPGTYQGYCAEFCGVEHAWMLIKTIAQPQAEYDAWIRQQSQPARPFPPASQPTPSAQPVPTTAAVPENPTGGASGAPPPVGNAVRGAVLFQQKTCITCHAINGTGANPSTAAPNLTHFAGRSLLAAGVLTNTPDNLARWLADPQKVKPGSYMPNFLLSTQEVQDLVTYLETLK